MSVEDLQEKIKNARDKGVGGKTPDQKQADKDSLEDLSNMQLGLRAGTELVVGCVAGGVLGYALDQWLNTKPLFFIMMLLLGFGSAILNVYKLTQKIGGSVGFAELHKKEKQGKKIPSDD